MESWGPLAAFASSFTWALGVSYYSVLGERVAPSAINTARALITLPLFFIGAILVSGGWSGAMLALGGVGPDRLLWLLISVFSSYAFGDALFFLSTRGLGPAGALAIASTYPLWAALSAFFFRGEALSLVSMLGLILIVAGTVMVILAAGDRLPASEELMGVSVDMAPARAKSVKATGLERKDVGFLLAIAASLCWSMNAYTVARGGDGISVFVGNTYRMLMAGICAPIIGWIMGRFAYPGRSLGIARKDLRFLLIPIVIEGFVGAIFFFYGLTHSPLAWAAALSALAPVIVVPIAVLLGREKFSWPRTIGVIGVCAGICALVLGRA